MYVGSGEGGSVSTSASSMNDSDGRLVGSTEGDTAAEGPSIGSMLGESVTFSISIVDSSSPSGLVGEDGSCSTSFSSSSPIATSSGPSGRMGRITLSIKWIITLPQARTFASMIFGSVSLSPEFPDPFWYLIVSLSLHLVRLDFPLRAVINCVHCRSSKANGPFSLATK